MERARGQVIVDRVIVWAVLAASSVTLRKSFNLSELQFLHSVAIVATAMRKINQDTGIECDRGSCFRGGGQGRPLGGVEGSEEVTHNF